MRTVAVSLMCHTVEEHEITHLSREGHCFKRQQACCDAEMFDSYRVGLRRFCRTLDVETLSTAIQRTADKLDTTLIGMAQTYLIGMTRSV